MYINRILLNMFSCGALFVILLLIYRIAVISSKKKKSARLKQP